MARSNLCKMLFFLCNSLRVFARYLFCSFSGFYFEVFFTELQYLWPTCLLASLVPQVDGQVFVCSSLCLIDFTDKMVFCCRVFIWF